MTDNEIIKALECCGDEEIHLCSVCPYYIQDKENILCQEDLHKDALSLINRQKAEIKDLQERNVILRCVVENQKVEIERLSNSAKQWEDTAKDLFISIENTKAEAIKEFAERLKAELSFGKYIQADQIDNLLKEMVGE